MVRGVSAEMRSPVLLERMMHGFQDTFQTVERADRCQDMRGIGPLLAPRLDPPPRFAGGQESIEEPLARIMGEQALPKFVQQGEVEPRVAQVEAERIFPIHAAADSISCLAIAEPFDVLHHQDQRPSAGGPLPRDSPRVDTDRQRADHHRASELCTELHVEVSLGKGGVHRGRRRVWHPSYRNS